MTERALAEQEVRMAKATPQGSYSAVWLRREGEHIKVLIECEGSFTEIISEHVNSQFSHIKNLPPPSDLAACHTEIRRCWAALRRLQDALEDYGEHDRTCALSQFEAGEPTPGGGYRSKYQGVWYESKPVDRTPPCTCGLSDLIFQKQL